jgi:hypothetical protein
MNHRQHREIEPKYEYPVPELTFGGRSIKLSCDPVIQAYKYPALVSFRKLRGIFV